MPACNAIRSDDRERFAQALAAEDLDSDGYTDLVVGIPGKNAGEVGDSGTVEVFFGSPQSLRTDNEQFWHLGTSGVAGDNQLNAEFGAVVAAGNVSLLFVYDFEHGNSDRWDVVFP